MKSFLAKLGPGLLYAGAAVGVSHLVQSTRAGASYGLWMVAVVIVANLLKYPFFKAGPIFSASTGKSLLDGFHQSGRWAMGLFYLTTFTSMFVVQAVVTLITASVLAYIFELTLPLWIISAGILLVCSIVLLIGRYRLLDHIMKSVIILLTITTLITLIADGLNYSEPTEAMNSFSFFNHFDVFFLIALVGWMPAPLDISLWHSEWTLAEAKNQQKALNIKRSTFDFHIGYWGTTFLAIAFVSLGALILRGSGKELPEGGAAFAGEVIGMYTSTIGKWSFAFIALAAFTTMFSTTLTILDAYPRVLGKALSLSFPKLKARGGTYYVFAMLIMIAGALFVLIFQLENMRQLVDFATTISFLAAPIIASLIYWVIKKSKQIIFTRLDDFIARLGLIFLYCFSFYYCWVKIG